MKLDVSKWNPFKFARKSVEEKRAEPAAATPDPTRSAMPEPLRMMQDMLASPLASASSLDRWFGDFSPNLFQPHIDVVDDGEALRLTAELPGMERKDIELLIEDDYLMLRGEKKVEAKSEEKGCYRLERAFGRFQRMIPLPDGLDTGRAEARFENGTLTLRIPKLEQAKASGRRININ